MLNARILSICVCLQVAYLFRDLLRFLLALDGSLELRMTVSTELFNLWPSYVDIVQILAIPVDVILLIWFWRMVEWK